MQSAPAASGSLCVGSNENPDIITILIESGADGKMTDSEGKTAFDYSKDNENLKDTNAYSQLSDARF